MSYNEAVKEILQKVRVQNKLTQKNIDKIKKEVIQKHKLTQVPSNIELLTHTPKQELNFLKKVLHTKPVRTFSGVAPIAIMTAPFACAHGKCTFCPGGPNSFFGDIPQSYTGHEPTTMRAIRNEYDSYLQVFNRLEQYTVLGHAANKVELIIMGGTFPAIPVEYQTNFVLGAFRAMNDFSEMFYKNGEFDFNLFKEFFELPGSIHDVQRIRNVQKKLFEIKNKSKTTLEYEQIRNEVSSIRCVALCIETKPDWGKLVHGNRLLSQGCTRVEIGVESVYDDVLLKTHREHTVQDTKESFQILRDLGFKISAHYMPGLPLTDKKRDFEGMKELFKSPDYRPDMLKLYPCMVSPGTALYHDYKKGLFIPLSTEESAQLIAEFKPFIPTYCRVQRINRDVPTKFWEAGVGITNLRQYIHEKYAPKCRCIRCREPKTKNINFENAKLLIQEYKASEGREFFISFEDTAQDLIFGFCRLRFPSQFLRAEITPNSALIREMHVYGQSMPLGEKGLVQHRGFGKLLLKKAEEIAKENGKDKMVVISGVGVREYYSKLGYRLEGPYMVKKL
ncbi:tRNA uridine(34) 5-carboxymethylaminomethyl modification radical SAM/GNAT enzyme Elp3 [Candidatus Woesearchaeota archaeon]|nr:tRNA uridine(34) 5-carboxymethylaminomethyl modification radical SAM/GNAT enzyme Elp3 [Candidatus Woesearchaeota archaeon]